MIGLDWTISADEPFLTDISVAHIILASSSKICQKFATRGPQKFRPNPHLLRGLPNK